MALGSKVFGLRFVLAFGIWNVMILAQTQICQFNILFIFNEQTLWIAHILCVCDYHTTDECRMMGLCARPSSMTWFTTAVNFESEVCVADWRHSCTHSDALAIKPNKQTTLEYSEPDWMIEFHIFIDWFRLISQCFSVDFVAFHMCYYLFVCLFVRSFIRLSLCDCSSARTFHVYVDTILRYGCMN